MKKLIFLILLCITDIGFGQFTNEDLNGSEFTGTATEVLPPDIDRMPIVVNETIRFVDGKVNSEFLKDYTADNCNYTAVVDERRMMAFKVVNVQYFSNGSHDGRNVTMEFSGNIIGDRNLYGNLNIKYSGNREENYIISAVSR